MNLPFSAGLGDNDPLVFSVLKFIFSAPRSCVKPTSDGDEDQPRNQYISGANS